MKLEIKNITKKFKNQTVIDDVSIKFTPGKIYGLVGRNGCGKSVLLKMICGIMTPNEGEILFDNEDHIRKYGMPKSTRALIENPEFIGSLTGYENLKLLASIQNTINDKRIMETLRLVGLDGDENKKFKEYSLGMKQKLGIAQVIMEDADLLIFDEPFNGLDEKSAKDIRNLLKTLKDKNKIIIIATHIKEDIETLIDELYKVDAGKVVKNDKQNKN